VGVSIFSLEEPMKRLSGRSFLFVLSAVGGRGKESAKLDSDGVSGCPSRDGRRSSLMTVSPVIGLPPFPAAAFIPFSNWRCCNCARACSMSRCLRDLTFSARLLLEQFVLVDALRCVL
jgi:hypothetical protein